jgi:branched-chain amino acid transport system substrate-binding protein
MILLLLFLLPPTELAAQHSGETGEKINIGLLIPDSKSLAAREGASLAVRLANERGGINGSHIFLIVRSMEGPWGTGSKQAVSLIFEDHVVAILGSHDGRNAHLAEQASAKTRVVFLSAWSSDPTLAQAFVPWFFNCVPNDIQQSETLAGEIFDRRKFTKVAVISGKDYDSESTLKFLTDQVKQAGKPGMLLIKPDDYGRDMESVVERLKKSGADCIILLVQPPVSLKIMERLRKDNIHIPVYCSLAQLDEDKMGNSSSVKNYDATFVCPVDLTGKSVSAFRDAYLKEYGHMPGEVASFAFDGMNILIDGIRKGGTQYVDIMNAIKGSSCKGVTGLIRFDDKGNRMGKPELAVIRNGIPVLRSVSGRVMELSVH